LLASQQESYHSLARASSSAIPEQAKQQPAKQQPAASRAEQAQKVIRGNSSNNSSFASVFETVPLAFATTYRTNERIVAAVLRSLC